MRIQMKITHIGIALQQVQQLLIHLLKLGPDMGKLVHEVTLVVEQMPKMLAFQ